MDSARGLLLLHLLHLVVVVLELRHCLVPLLHFRPQRLEARKVLVELLHQLFVVFKEGLVGDGTLRVGFADSACFVVVRVPLGVQRSCLSPKNLVELHQVFKVKL